MKHIPSLDGVRALAVLEVLAFHCRVPGSDGGFLGVDVFFVLSGFLITTMLAKEAAESGTIRFRHFYMQRVLRLAPTLAAMLAVYIAFGPHLFPQWSAALHWRDAGIAALYLSDYATAFWHVPNVVRHTWSLSVEEHYYLLWPLVLLAGLRLKRPQLILLLVAFYCVDTAWRDLVFSRAGWNEPYCRFDTRLTGLVLGGITALSGARLPQRWAGLVGALALFVIVAGLALFRWLNYESFFWGIPTAELAATMLILSVLSDAKCAAARLLSLRPITFIGTLSYAIYLWHYPIARLLRDHLPWQQTFAITLTFSIALATASYFLIEKPVNRWRRQFKVGRTDTSGLIRVASGQEAVRSTRVAPEGFSPSPPLA